MNLNFLLLVGGKGYYFNFSPLLKNISVTSA